MTGEETVIDLETPQVLRRRVFLVGDRLYQVTYIHSSTDTS